MKVKRVLIIAISLVFIIAIGFTVKGKKASAAYYADDYVIDNVKVRNVTTKSAELYWRDSSYRRYYIIEHRGGREFKKVAETTNDYYYIEELEPGEYTDDYVVIGCDDNIKNENYFYLDSGHYTVEILTEPEKIDNLRCTEKNIIDKDPINSYIELDWKVSDGADMYDIFVDNKYVKTSKSNDARIYLNQIYGNLFNKYCKFTVVPVAKKYGISQCGEDDDIRFYIRRDLLRVRQELTYDENSILLTWKNADFYKKLYIYVYKNNKWEFLNVINEKDRNLVFKNLKANTYMKLKFEDGDKNILDNVEVITPPKKIENIEVCDITDNKVALKWKYENDKWYVISKYNSKTNTYEKIYEVYNTGKYICKNLKPCEKNKIIVSKRVSYPGRGADYYYSASGSPSVIFYTKFDLVKNLHISKMKKNSIQVAWDNNEYADGYYIYVYDKDGKLITKEKTYSCDYTYKCDKENVDIIIKVEAFAEIINNGNKEEVVSYDMSKVNASNYLNIPTNVHTENKVTGYVKLAWSKVDYANKYEVYTVKKNSNNKKEYTKVGETKKLFYELDINSLKDKTIFVVKAVFDYKEGKMESDYSQYCEYVKK